MIVDVEPHGEGSVDATGTGQADGPAPSPVLLLDTIELRARIECPHTKDDRLNPAYHEWVLLSNGFRGEPAIEKRDSLGRRHRFGYRPWIRMFCNNPQCDGRLLVDGRSLANALDVAVPE